MVSWLAKEEAPDYVKGRISFKNDRSCSLLSTGTALKRTQGGQIEEEAFRTEVTEI